MLIYDHWFYAINLVSPSLSSNFHCPSLLIYPGDSLKTAARHIIHTHTYTSYTHTYTHTNNHIYDHTQ